ncbi:hypothetical protein BJ742DRAFT_223350 [Cladochytrium replicatum]|nr:hypothetical protein BJ742DRAFT_223350 [Cladochytrium replicatum]
MQAGGALGSPPASGYDTEMGGFPFHGSPPANRPGPQGPQGLYGFDGQNQQQQSPNPQNQPPMWMSPPQQQRPLPIPADDMPPEIVMRSVNQVNLTHSMGLVESVVVDSNDKEDTRSSSPSSDPNQRRREPIPSNGLFDVMSSKYDLPTLDRPGLMSKSSTNQQQQQQTPPKSAQTPQQQQQSNYVGMQLDGGRGMLGAGAGASITFAPPPDPLNTSLSRAREATAAGGQGGPQGPVVQHQGILANNNFNRSNSGGTLLNNNGSLTRNDPQLTRSPSQRGMLQRKMSQRSGSQTAYEGGSQAGYYGAEPADEVTNVIFSGYLFKQNRHGRFQRRLFRFDGYILLCLSPKRERLPEHIKLLQFDPARFRGTEYADEFVSSLGHFYPGDPPSPALTNPLIAAPTEKDIEEGQDLGPEIFTKYYYLPKWIIPTQEIKSVRAVVKQPAKDPESPKGRSFIIRTAKRDYILRAPTGVEFQRWTFLLSRMSTMNKLEVVQGAQDDFGLSGSGAQTSIWDMMRPGGAGSPSHSGHNRSGTRRRGGGRCSLRRCLCQRLWVLLGGTPRVIWLISRCNIGLKRSHECAQRSTSEYSGSGDCLRRLISLGKSGTGSL